MAKAKFQDTLKNGLTGVATVGKKIVDTAGDGAAAAISKGKEQLDKAINAFIKVGKELGVLK